MLKNIWFRVLVKMDRSWIGFAGCEAWGYIYTEGLECIVISMTLGVVGGMTGMNDCWE